MANSLNEFDRLIRETYENHQFDYSPNGWEDINAELDSAAPSFGAILSSVATGLLMTVVIFSSLAFLNVGYLDGESTTVEDNQKQSGFSETHFESETRDGKLSLDEEVQHISQQTAESDNAITEEVKQSAFNDAQKETVKALIAEAKSLVSNEEANAENETENSSIVRGCAGLTIDFESPTDYGSSARYLWNFGDGNFSNEENPTHVFSKEGTFDVSLSVTGGGSGQISSDVVQAMIEVFEAPRANFDLKMNPGGELLITNTSLNAHHSFCEVNGISLEEKNGEFLTTAIDNTKYEILMIAENKGACTDSLEKVVHVIKAGNQFPQVYAISHSGSFAPGAIVDNGEVRDFRVFDQNTGKEVFQSTGRKGWNGKDKDGAKVEKGNYLWTMIVDGKDATNIYKGNVSVR